MTIPNHSISRVRDDERLFTDIFARNVRSLVSTAGYHPHINLFAFVKLTTTAVIGIITC